MRILCLVSLICLVMFSSCAPKIYLPDRVNVPMLREQGEVKLTSSIKISTNNASSKFVVSPSFDFAVSPVDHFGIIGSFRSTSKYSDEEDWYSYNYQDSIHYTGNRGELGAGYYLPFGGKGLFELYGGGSFGFLERNNLKYSDGEFRTGYYQIFLQPSVGFYQRDIMDLCGGIRFSYHKYNKFSATSPQDRYYFTDPQSDIETGTFIFLGPFVNVNVGYEYVKFNLQAGGNINVGTPRLLQGNMPFYVSIGATFAYAPRFSQEERSERSTRNRHNR